MMYEANELIGKSLYTIDQKLGTITDIYFDDRRWKILYLQVSLDDWANHDDVLLSLNSLASFTRQHITVLLTKHEILHNSHFNDAENQKNNHSPLSPYDQFVRSAEVGEQAVFPMVSTVNTLAVSGTTGRHLRSYKQFLDYTIVTNDGFQGAVNGFLFDDRSWSLWTMIFTLKERSDIESRLIDPVFIDMVDPAKEAVLIGRQEVFLYRCPIFDRNKFTNIPYEDFKQLVGH